MEVLNDNCGLLSNFEVYQIAQEDKHLDSGQGFLNINSLNFEVKKYLKSSPCAIQTPEFIEDLLEYLKDVPITKAERLMIINLQPSNEVEFSCLIGEVDERFELEECAEITGKLIEIYKRHDPKPSNGYEHQVLKAEDFNEISNKSVEIQQQIMSDF